jgi:hypothetical protein
MSDSPEQFVLDVIEADREYAHGVTVDTFLGNFRVEVIGLKKDTARIIAEPILNMFLQPALEKIDAEVENLKKIVKNPPECIDSENTYQGVQYFATVEAPYAEAFIDNTFLKDEVVIPPGTDEYLEKLARIPRCNGS